MSQRNAAQACPIPCGWESELPLSQAPCLMLSYVEGWICMVREYGRFRSPGLVRGGS
jgi:hypothetical protein